MNLWTHSYFNPILATSVCMDCIHFDIYLLCIKPKSDQTILKLHKWFWMFRTFCCKVLCCIEDRTTDRATNTFENRTSQSLRSSFSLPLCTRKCALQTHKHWISNDLLHQMSINCKVAKAQLLQRNTINYFIMTMLELRHFRKLNEHSKI